MSSIPTFRVTPIESSRKMLDKAGDWVGWECRVQSVYKMGWVDYNPLARI